MFHRDAFRPPMPLANSAAWRFIGMLFSRRNHMAKGQMKAGKEARKPKKVVVKQNASKPSLKGFIATAPKK